MTFSAIDKVGHMWGGGAVDTLDNYEWDPKSILREVHMPWAAKNADDQLGRLIKKLKPKGQFDDTLIVVTADHGSTYGGKGVLRRQRVRRWQHEGWYAVTWFPGYGTDPYVPNTATPARTPSSRSWTRQVDVQLSVDRNRELAHDGRPTSWDEVPAAAMKTLPGVIATYIKDGDHYKRTGRATR